MALFNDASRLRAARDTIRHFAPQVDMPVGIRLWDGSMHPLGDEPDPRYYIQVDGPETVAALLRRPTLERFLALYARGKFSFHGGDLVDFAAHARSKRMKKKLKRAPWWPLLPKALPFLLYRPARVLEGQDYTGNYADRKHDKDDDRRFVQFHYDIGNEFYQLFLDPEMQYSCAYFRHWEGSLEQAQLDKLEMICRKLRLRPGERFLDIGCGWGGLVCYAAKHYGVQAHGVTLAQNQHDYAQEKIKSMGLEKQVRVEMRDYRDLDGKYDKIASIGMYEHVGIANYRKYFRRMYKLLRDRGIFLNHGITRPAKQSDRKFHKISPGRRWILKYVFPGSELDHIGHTVRMIESCGFEVHDVEGWREHYARTTRLWAKRLAARREEAEQIVGPEKYRLWMAYLTGVSFTFLDGPLGIFQTVATKHQAKGPSLLEPTREELYRGDWCRPCDVSDA